MKHLNPRTKLQAFLRFTRFAGLTAAVALVPAVANAQTAPYQQPAEVPPAAPGPQAPLPSYASDQGPSVQGTIVRLDGKYQIHVRDAKGYLDNVTLHSGTIINPTGFPLEVGQHVTIEGQPAGSSFEANEIDIPEAVAFAPYGYGYGYPGYGYPYYGTSVGIGFGFGHRFGGWR
jgi:hypothetical protein